MAATLAFSRKSIVSRQRKRDCREEVKAGRQRLPYPRLESRVGRLVAPRQLRLVCPTSGKGGAMTASAGMLHAAKVVGAA